jgi:hypothetical protein
LARAHQGQFATAREALETARSLAQDPVDVQKIEQAFETLVRLEQAKGS